MNGSVYPATLARNRMEAGIILLGLGVVVFLLSYQAPESWNFHLPASTTRISVGILQVQFDIGWVGVEFGIGLGRPEPPGHLCPDAFHDGVWFCGLMIDLESLIWWNAGTVVHVIVIGIPWWFVGALAAWRETVGFLQNWDERARRRKEFKRRQRLQDYHAHPVCRSCGYDMRATRQQCPECGWIPGPELQPPSDEAVAMNTGNPKGRHDV